MTNSTEMKPGLSALIITKNEAHRLAACLESVAFCDEIIVVDSGSTDGTAELAESLGCRVSVVAEWPGFGEQKQRALDLARYDWILSVDADELISAELRRAIETTITAAPSQAFAGYSIRRVNLFLGSELRHGGWGADHVTRLARRIDCRFSPDRVHEKLLVSGLVGNLEEPIIHDARASLQDVLEKQARYVLIYRQSVMRAGDRPSIGRALLGGGLTFLAYYFLRLGMLDGAPGFFAAASRAQGKFWMKSRIKARSPSAAMVDNPRGAPTPNR